MTAFKSYFKSHLKQSTKTLIYILIISVVITLLVALTGQVYEDKNYLTGEVESINYYSTIYTPIFLLVVLCYIIPVTEFSFFKKRINLDCAYSLPISRRAMGSVHFLMGLITVIAAFSASYLTNFIMLLIRGAEHYNLAPLLFHYPVSLLLGAAIYSFTVFVFCEANTKGDGIWFIALWTFAPILVFACIEYSTSTNLIFDYATCAIHWGALDTFTMNVQYMVEISDAVYYSPEEFFSSAEAILWIVGWILVGVMSTVALYRTFGKRRMEKTEEISDSYFGYRTLIPLFAITGNIVFDDVVFWIIIEILAVVGYTIYRRGFHYKKSEVALLIGLIQFLFI